MSPDKVCMIVTACAELHNMAILWKQPLLEDEHAASTYPEDILEFDENVQLASKH